jgi:hypothetical protein
LQLLQSRYRPDHQVDALARVCVEVELTVARRKAGWSIGSRPGDSDES